MNVLNSLPSATVDFLLPGTCRIPSFRCSVQELNDMRHLVIFVNKFPNQLGVDADL